MNDKLAFTPGSSMAYHTGDWRTQQPQFRNKWPPCGQTCPASEDIQAYLALASEQKWEAAWRKLTERNPLPAVMGRICFHPCELGCNRKHLDSAVNIHAVERHLGDMALQHEWRHQRLEDSNPNEKIAVIGAGPAGLSCAFQLARRGYPVSIFDSASNPGGTLYSSIPDYRLSKAVLAQEIESILSLNITLQLNTRVGQDVTMQEIREKFSAVFVAIGTQQPRIFPGSDQSTHSVYNGIEFLRDINRGQLPELSKKVAVIGGGNTAIDVARCARRLGVEVSVICPQRRHGHHHGHAESEMPASLQEVLQAEAEGVQIHYQTGVNRLVRNGEHLSGVEIAQVEEIRDHNGNKRPLLFKGTEEFLPAGRVIFAIGQQVDWSGLDGIEEITAPNIIIGGDAAGKPRFAPTAIGSGYEAAMSIIASITGIPTVYEHHQKAEINVKGMHLHYYPIVKRNDDRLMEQAEQVSTENFFKEINQGLNQDAVDTEVNRCLSCGVCLDCDNCWHFCPDAALIKKSDGYEIDYDYCKGCGICAQECPSGHIDMERTAV